MCYHPTMRPYVVAVLLLTIAGPAAGGGPAGRSPAPLQPGTVRNGRAARARGRRHPGARRRRARRPRPDSARAFPPVRRPARSRRMARESLRMVDTAPLDAAERVELTIGLAEALYFEERYGAAAQLFESVRQRSALLGTPAHERVLDWWATAVDRQAQTRQAEERPAIYARVLDRMTEEIAEYPGSTAAGYWLAAAARASGDVERAWHAALAGWLRAHARRRPRRRAPRRPRSADDAGHHPRTCRQACRQKRSARQDGSQGGAGRDDRPSGRPSRRRWTQVELRASYFASAYFASFQFSPIPTSTVSGTFSVTACSISSRTRGRRFLGGFLRRLEQQLVVHGQDHARASAGDAGRAPRGRRSSRASGCRRRCPGSASSPPCARPRRASGRCGVLTSGTSRRRPNIVLTTPVSRALRRGCRRGTPGPPGSRRSRRR